MDAVIYTRNAQPNRRAHASRKEACERLAAELGFEVVSDFHDIGRTRPAPDQLLATVRDHKASAMIVADLDRLGRTFDSCSRIMESLGSAEVPLYVVRQGRVSLPTSPALGMMRAIAEYEAEHAEGITD